MEWSWRGHRDSVLLLVCGLVDSWPVSGVGMAWEGWGACALWTCWAVRGALLGVALQGPSQGTDFVLFSSLLLWMLPTFQRMLFYSLINGLPVVQVIVVVHAEVGLAVDVIANLWVYCWVSFLVLLLWFE